MPLQIQSSFMTDLQQVVLALKMATKKSLVILDEFGKGTTSTGTRNIHCCVMVHSIMKITMSTVHVCLLLCRWRRDVLWCH